MFSHLAEAEYFIYPLYTPYKDVHKDTFSCVVAEAIALGCTVLTYPLGALPENFDGYVYWLPEPEGANFDTMNEEPLSKDEEGIFTTTDNIVSALNYLEDRRDYKDQITAGGYIILDKFSTDTVGRQWDNFINEMIGE